MKKIYPFLLILLVVFLAYGQTLTMYFWQDDNALIFKLQHIAEGVGSFGNGLFDRDTAYRYLVVPFAPLFPIFGLHPQGYFFIGIFMYFFASLGVYFLTYMLTHNKKVSLFASLIFSAGYVGSDTMWRVINSYQTCLTIVLLCTTVGIYKLYIDKKHILLYGLSLIVFMFTLEVMFVRAHGIIFLIVGLELLFNFQFIKSLLRMTPFIYMYYYYYIPGNTSTKNVSILLQTIFVKHDLTVLLIPLKTVENIFIPDYLNISLILFAVLLTTLLIWKRNRILIYALIFIVGNFVIYFLEYQDQSLTTTHRYLTPSFVGLSLFFAVLLRQIFKSDKRYIVACFAVIVFYLVNVNMYEYQIVTTRSIPTRKFYHSLQQELPKFPKGAALYFDVRNDGISSGQFGNFFGVGSMPETTAIAIYYGIDRYDLYMPATFQELLGLVKNGKVQKDKIFTFYYNSVTGLKNTTKGVRKALFGNNNEVSGVQLAQINMQLVSPARLTTDITTSIDSTKIYYEKNQTTNLVSIFSYLQDQNEYYKTAVATTSSEWKYHESPNIIDQDITTSWQAHRMSWHYGRKEEVTIALGTPELIGAVKFVTGSKVAAPTMYSYKCSVDSNSWKQLGSFIFSPTGDNETVINKIAPTECRYVTITITQTYMNESPQIAEIELIQNSDRNINFATAQEVASNPFSFITSSSDMSLVTSYLQSQGITASICFHTNKYNIISAPCNKVPLSLGENNNLSTIIPQGGTLLEQISILVPVAIKVNTESSKIKPLSLDELNDEGYITIYTTN